MSRIPSLADHLAPDSIGHLERAAEMRFKEAERLVAQKCTLTALYLFGYAVEMCISAAYYRSAGFSLTSPIDRDTRRRRMAQARQIQGSANQPIMNSDPHPLVGWARFLEWQRRASNPTSQELLGLREAIGKAELVYKHWRPELRYMTTTVRSDQLDEVRKTASWFLERRGRL